MKKIILLLILFPLVLSCEKESMVVSENTDIPLINKVISGDKTYAEYTYNDENLVMEEKSKFHYSRYNYNNRNELTSSEHYFDIAMTSSDSKVIEAAMNRKEWVNPGNTDKSLTKSFFYNNSGIRIIFERQHFNNEYCEYIIENGRAVRQNMYWNARLTGYINYFYDDRGNLLKEERYLVPETSRAVLNTTTDYEYDHMNNPFRAFKRLIIPGRYTNPNNIIREIYTLYFDVPPGTGQVQVKEYSYDYDIQGYPIRVNGDMEYVYK